MFTILGCFFQQLQQLKRTQESTWISCSCSNLKQPVTRVECKNVELKHSFLVFILSRLNNLKNLSYRRLSSVSWRMTYFRPLRIYRKRRLKKPLYLKKCLYCSICCSIFAILISVTVDQQKVNFSLTGVNGYAFRCLTFTNWTSVTKTV
jgi:ABC-type uncharacterized transport system involved in gliding motility auxiliary subunit